MITALVVGYVVGLRRWNTPDSGPWPFWRTLSWSGAMVMLVIALLSGLASWDATDFTIHATIDALVGVMAPVLAAIGAPLTLMAGAGPAGARRVRQLLDHPVTRALTYPLGAWVVFALSIFVLYTGSWWRTARHHEILLQLGHLELLAAGCLLIFPVIGADLADRRIRAGWTIGYLLGLVPLWTLFGMWVESATHALGPDAGVAAVNRGGGLLWTVGSLTGIVTGVGVLYHWLFVDLARVTAHEEVDVEALDMQAAVWRVSRIPGQDRPGAGVGAGQGAQGLHRGHRRPGRPRGLILSRPDACATSGAGGAGPGRPGDRCRPGPHPRGGSRSRSPSRARRRRRP